MVMGVLIALGAWLFPVNKELEIDNFSSKNYNMESKVELKITGANINVNIRKGKYPYSGGILSAANSESTIFINENQILTIDVSGANIDLFIDSLIRENIIVNSNGANLKIKEI